jgi:hypothetical protein
MAFPSAIIRRNFIPAHFRKIENKSKYEDMYYDTKACRILVKPRIGAFEVKIGDANIFSKLEIGRWPHFPTVVADIKEHLSHRIIPTPLAAIREESQPAIGSVSTKNHKEKDRL